MDDGGPRREFFHLATKAMADDHTIFHGPENRLSFVHNTQSRVARKFYYSGLLIALSLANGGPAFPCLAECVFKYLCSGGDMSKVHSEVDDIPDLGITQKLRKVCMLW